MRLSRFHLLWSDTVEQNRRVQTSGASLDLLQLRSYHEKNQVAIIKKRMLIIKRRSDTFILLPERRIVKHNKSHMIKGQMSGETLTAPLVRQLFSRRTARHATIPAFAGMTRTASHPSSRVRRGPLASQSRYAPKPDAHSPAYSTAGRTASFRRRGSSG